MHRLQHRTHLAVCLGFGWFCPGLEQRKGKEGKGKGEKRKKSKRGAPDTALSLPTSMLGGSGASSPCRVVIPCSGDQLQELPPTSPAALQVPTRGHEAGAPLLGRSLRCPAPRCWWDPAQHLQQPMERSCLKPCSSEPHAPPAPMELCLKPRAASSPQNLSQRSRRAVGREVPSCELSPALQPRSSLHISLFLRSEAPAHIPHLLPSAHTARLRALPSYPAPSNSNDSEPLPAVRRQRSGGSASFQTAGKRRWEPSGFAKGAAEPARVSC